MARRPPRWPVTLHLEMNKITWHVTSHLDSLLLMFFPAMTEGHMGIEILHPTEGMIMGLTPLHPAEERPLLAGFWLHVVVCSLMGFLTPYCFAQYGQMKTSSGAGCSGP